MKCFILLVAFWLFSALANSAYAVGWTGEIEHVRVWNSDKAEIFISNPRNPNPSGSIWNCGDYNIVLIGNPVKPSLLSLAMTAWMADKSVRINVEGSGTSCSTSYIETTNP